MINSPLPLIKIQENITLAPFTTFKIGGQCKKLIQCQSPAQLENIVDELIQNNEEFILIGGGSNLVISDQGIPCTVIRYVCDKAIIELNGLKLTVSGSTNLDDLVSFAASHDLEGLNYASGIPGTVGGAIIGNAGAFGKQLGDILVNVVLLSRSGKKRIAKPEEMEFAYRHSKLKTTDDIVIEATFQMNQGDGKKLRREREEILQLRKEKHPDLQSAPCAGSFFKNVEATSKADKRQAAGWFLEQAGASDLMVGDAKVFEKHANIIVNGGSATAEDVYQLSAEMAALVKSKFDLDLIREVRFVGNFEGMPEGISDLIW